MIRRAPSPDQGARLEDRVAAFAASLDRLPSRRVLARIGETETGMAMIDTRLDRQVRDAPDRPGPPRRHARSTDDRPRRPHPGDPGADAMEAIIAALSDRGADAPACHQTCT